MNKNEKHLSLFEFCCLYHIVYTSQYNTWTKELRWGVLGVVELAYIDLMSSKEDPEPHTNMFFEVMVQKQSINVDS